jgi:cysteine desulfuration protein SufE
LRPPHFAPYIQGVSSMTIERIIEDFEVLDSWDDRYRYVIDLGRGLEPLPASAHIDANKVQGCASQVWFVSQVKPAKNGGGPVIELHGDSDAHIVKGLIAILFALYSGRPARAILETDAIKLFNQLGLGEHLTPQRSNGFRSMVERIRADARAALAKAA